MTFNPRDLSVVGYANGFTLWHFRSGDAAKQIATPKYFNASSDMLRPGDFIFVNLENRTLARYFGSRFGAGWRRVSRRDRGAVLVKIP